MGRTFKDCGEKSRCCRLIKKTNWNKFKPRKNLIDQWDKLYERFPDYAISASGKIVRSTGFKENA